MITVNLVCVGSVKEIFYKNAVEEYLKRLKKFCKVNVIEVPEYKNSAKVNDTIIETIKQQESISLEKHFSGYTILLDKSGQALTSEQLASKINQLSFNYSTITFIIGGSFGVSEELKKQVNYILSFSNFTFPHQLMRVVLAEQIYRAFTINNNITYHK